MPYFVHRTSYFVLPVTEKDMEDVGWTTKIENIEGDIYVRLFNLSRSSSSFMEFFFVQALEAHLYDVVSPLCEFDPAISVDEAEMTILIRGTYLAQIEEFLYKNNF